MTQNRKENPVMIVRNWSDPYKGGRWRNHIKAWRIGWRKAAKK